MCYIMISKRINNERNPLIEEQLKAIAINKTLANPDGFFISYAGASVRTMSQEEAQKTIKDIPFDNTFMHFRFATVGKKHINNVHGWEKNGYVFAHNGGVYEGGEYEDNYNAGYKVSKLKDSLKQEQTDSELLFDKILEKMAEFGYSDKKVIKAIKTAVNNCSFWGRCVLYDKVHDKAFLFGDWKSYLVNESYLVYSSHDIIEPLTWERTTHGMKFEYEVNPLPNAIEQEFDGIALIRDFNKPTFQFKLRGELKDISFDKREYYSAPLLSEEEQEQLEIEEYNRSYGINTKKPNTKVRELNEGYSGIDNMQDQTDEILDTIEDFPEYQDMQPFDMDTFTNETGTHDVYSICCRNQCCWIFDTAVYRDYRKQLASESIFDKQPVIGNTILAQM